MECSSLVLTEKQLVKSKVFKENTGEKTSEIVFFLGLHGTLRPQIKQKQASLCEKSCNFKNVQTQFMNISKDVSELHLSI